MTPCGLFPISNSDLYYDVDDCVNSAKNTTRENIIIYFFIGCIIAKKEVTVGIRNKIFKV